MNEQELQQIKDIQMKQLKGLFVTPSEFSSILKVLVKAVKDLRTNIQRERGEDGKRFDASYQDMVRNIGNLDREFRSIAAVISNVDKKGSKDVQKLRDDFTSSINDLKKLIPAAADLKKIESQIREVDSRIPVIKETVLDTPIQLRDKLETLKGDERLDKTAIKGLKEDMERIERIAAMSKGGGVSAPGVAHAFKSIAHTEEPTGLINGVNTTYTVKNNIWWVFGFTLNGEQVAELPNFTYVNKTITFSTPIPAAYSGKDFEIKYIGT